MEDLVNKYRRGEITLQEFLTKAKDMGSNALQQAKTILEDAYKNTTPKSIVENPTMRRILAPITGLVDYIGGGEETPQTPANQTTSQGVTRNPEDVPKVIVPPRGPSATNKTNTRVRSKKQLLSKITERKTMSEPVNPNDKLTAEEKFAAGRVRNPRNY